MDALLGKPSRDAEAGDNAVRERAVEALRRMQYVGEVSTAEALFRQVLEQHKPAGPMAERIRKALEKPVKVNFQELAFPDLLKELEKLAPGITFRDWMTPYKDKPTITLRFDDPVPLSTLLQAIEDYYVPGTVLHGIRFVVRDYGLLVCHQMHLPPGAVTVQEFLRQKPREEPRQQPRGGNNPPAESVEGVVKSVDAGGLMTISIGSDAGLAKGQTLELYWKPHRPPIEDARGFGTVRVLEVEAHQAVVKPVGDVARRLQPGDRITGILKK